MLPQQMVAPIILASGSPRRRELLSIMGVSYETIVLDTDEICSGEPNEQVCILAERKAAAVAGMHGDRFVLAADTLVAKDDRILGKPESIEEAVDMLMLLSGGWHEVYTGVCLWDVAGGRKRVEYDMTQVRFSAFCEASARAYAATGEPMDKAGAYAIQGRGGMFVEEIRGSASNVIGLPMALVRKMLLEFGICII